VLSCLFVIKGMCCLIHSSKRWDVRSTYRLSQWHRNW